MAQGEAQATLIAERARREFERELTDALRAAAECLRVGPAQACYLESALPTWLDGVFTWDGQDLRVLRPPSDGADYLVERATSRLAVRAPRPIEQIGWSRAELIYDVESTSPVVLGCIRATDAEGQPVVLAGHVQLGRLKSDLVEPLLSADIGLELVPSGATDGRWSQPLFGVMHFWSIQPTGAFLREQRNAVLGQTFIYLALTILALGTLLIAMWVLMRVVRRDMALAEMKANFVADVSHELKTPLALIRMFGETLQAGRVPTEEKRAEYYAIITRESTRLTDLINNILDFARIDAGRKTYVFEATNIVAVVRETYEAYRAQLEHNEFDHHLTVDESVPEVNADRDAIARALINLIHNAMKYSGEERYLAIDVAQDTRRGKRGVLISVHDRGIGIQPEDRRRVFEGFFRASDGRVTKVGGAGLGLALVKHIIDAHGGSLHVESRLVKGSTFRIFLPGLEHSVVQSPATAPDG
jgi:signal transduction histidine kinase